MYLAMNRFKVPKDRAKDFETMWLGRDSELPDLDGFVEFRLLKGPEFDEYTLYSSHTFWESEDDFIAWTKSEAFIRSHSGTKSKKAKPLTLGHPEFEGFTTLQMISKEASKN